MIGYKLFRQRKDKTLGSLFINRKAILPINKWMEAEEHPTNGYKFRPQWHVLLKPDAPHLSMRGRVWYMVEVKEYTKMIRPDTQGGIWLLANQMKILEKIII